jgi:hypothetical protein
MFVIIQLKLDGERLVDIHVNKESIKKTVYTSSPCLAAPHALKLSYEETIIHTNHLGHPFCYDRSILPAFQ